MSSFNNLPEATPLRRNEQNTKSIRQGTLIIQKVHTYPHRSHQHLTTCSPANNVPKDEKKILNHHHLPSEQRDELMCHETQTSFRQGGLVAAATSVEAVKKTTQSFLLYAKQVSK